MTPTPISSAAHEPTSAALVAGHAHHPPHTHDGHPHTHGTIDPTIATSDRGLWAVKWSLVGLVITALSQGVVFGLSGSVALLADLIHNVGDAMTALPLGLAFWASRWKPTPRFAYGYGRLEDLAGVAIVAIIFGSALITAYESIDRFYHPQPLHHLGALAIAAVIGFIGNETVALFRMRVGREINSAALIADGQHAMADGLVSLAVLVSAIGVGLGYPWADPTIGLVITGILLTIVWESGQTIFARLLDGVEPEILAVLQHTAEQVEPIAAVSHLRARWLGHRLQVEMAVAIEPSLSVQAMQDICTQVEAALKADIPYLGEAVVRGIPHPSAPPPGSARA